MKTYINYIDLVSHQSSSLCDFYDAFKLGIPSVNSSSHFAFTPKILDLMPTRLKRSFLSDSLKHLSCFDHLTLSWAYLASKLARDQYEGAQILGASARAHDDHYLHLAGREQPTFLSSPVSTPSGGLQFIGSMLKTQRACTLVSNTCLSFAAAVDAAVKNISYEPEINQLIFSGEVHGDAFKTEMFKMLRVYDRGSGPFKNMSYSDKRCGMFLGDGSAVVQISSLRDAGTMASIDGILLSRDSGAHLTQVASIDAISHSIRECLVKAGWRPQEVDAVFGHGSATQSGDKAELMAYQEVFGEKLPHLYSTKWLSGHMLGASAAFSLALGCEVMKKGDKLTMPYDLIPETRPWEGPIKKCISVTLGFNGQIAIIAFSKA